MGFKMQFIEWSSDMSVGSDVLDGHHKMIIDCLNQLHPLIDAKGKDDEVRAVLAKLEEFVLVHFSEEEQCMKKVGYPYWQAHKSQHDKMYDIVFDMISELEHGRSVDAKHLFSILYEWLFNHIMKEDKKYVYYLQNPAPQGGAVWTRSNGRPY